MALNPKLRDWQGKVVWLVGASSGIGLALAQALHARGARVCVSARQAERLRDFVLDHPGSLALPLDVLDAAALQLAARQIARQHGRIDLCVFCAGHYQAMRAQQFSLAEARRQLDVNLVGAMNLLDALLPQLTLQAHQGLGGHLSLVSSVAGYRGLPKALAYGPSKAALTHLAEVLYLDLRPLQLGVSVVHPGFVATPLTAGNDFHMPALIKPGQAAEAMLQGWAAGRFEIHFPRRFTLWLKLLRLLPYGLYFRLVRRATQS
ncbi:SDR family NAD(P)-dependent oxidoreductase [Paucibacter soli]|uniref:SDR family NAD(P)-dependent oxidoreductase n=1 Tax=Paucibacter soli TaxID=3133433 RepID=UPI0030B35E18